MLIKFQLKKKNNKFNRAYGIVFQVLEQDKLLYSKFKFPICFTAFAISTLDNSKVKIEISSSNSPDLSYIDYDSIGCRRLRVFIRGDNDDADDETSDIYFANEKERDNYYEMVLGAFRALKSKYSPIEQKSNVIN